MAKRVCKPKRHKHVAIGGPMNGQSLFLSELSSGACTTVFKMVVNGRKWFGRYAMKNKEYFTRKQFKEIGLTVIPIDGVYDEDRTISGLIWENH